MKIFIEEPVESLTLKRIKTQWISRKSHLTSDRADDADIIWILDPNSWRAIDHDLLNQKKVICSVHSFSKINIYCENVEIDPIQDFRERDKLVNEYHVPNKYVYNNVARLTGKPKNILEYWYDAILWQEIQENYVTGSIKKNHSQSRKLLGIDKDVFVVGSFQDDSKPSSITPIKEKGPDIFCSYVENIRFENSIKKDREGNTQGIKTLALLGGKNRLYVKNRLSQSNIPYMHIENADHEKLRQMYNACDLYPVTCRESGGPHNLFEAASMKIPIVSVRENSAESVLAPNCIQRIPEKVYIPSIEDIEQNYQNVQKYDIITHIEKYELMFRKLYESDGI